MLGFMGRENLEDYNADFLCMFEAWEAAAEFLDRDREKPQHVDIARLLGWTESYRSTKAKSGFEEKMNATAIACSPAHELVTGGYLTRGDLSGLTVRSARDICSATVTRMKQIEELGRERKAKKDDIEHGKKRYAAGAKGVIKDTKAGKLSWSQARGAVDAYTAPEWDRPERSDHLVLPVVFRALNRQIAGILAGDTAAQKLDQLIAAKDQIVMAEDIEVVSRTHDELGYLRDRAEKYSIALIRDKVVTFKPLNRGNES